MTREELEKKIKQKTEFVKWLKDVVNVKRGYKGA